MPLMSTILDCIIQPVFSSSHSTLIINGLVRHLSGSFAKKRTVDHPFELGTHYFLIQQHSDYTRWILSMKLRGLSFHAKRCSGKWCRGRNYISRKRPEGNARASRMQSPLTTSGWSLSSNSNMMLLFDDELIPNSITQADCQGAD